MAAVWELILQQYKDYFAASLYPLLFLLSLLFICFYPDAKQERDSLVFPNLLVGAVIFCPPSAYLVMKMVGYQVYWRMFWMFTLPIVCGYAFVKLVTGFSKKSVRILVAVLAALVLFLGGESVFNGKNFSVSKNAYKLPAEVIQVADVISADAKEREIDSPKAVVPANLCPYIRQYDAGIRLAYGRNMVKKEVKRTLLYYEMNRKSPKARRLARLARKAGCAYLVLPADASLRGALPDYLYDVVEETAGYVVYVDTWEGQE